MNVGLPWSGGGGRLKLDDGFRRSPQAVESFTHEDVRGRGIRTLLDDLAELALSAGVVFRQQAALCQYLAEFRVGRILPDSGLKILGSVREFFRTIAT